MLRGVSSVCKDEVIVFAALSWSGSVRIRAAVARFMRCGGCIGCYESVLRFLVCSFLAQEWCW